MEQNLDQVRQELADIHDELLALPVDAFGRRSELRDRQNELRQLSHKLLEDHKTHDADYLRKAYNRLHAVRDELLEKHITTASTSVGDAGIEGEFTTAINKAISSGLGIDDIETRLKEILKQMRNAD